jgi:hypothetical protein
MSWGYCWKWNSRSSDKNRIWTSVHKILTSLWHLNQSCQESGEGLDEQKSHTTMGIQNWTQSDKGTYIRILCQKNKGSVEIKQRPIKMDSWTIYRTLTSKRTPFQIGTGRWSHLWKVTRGRWVSNTFPMWLWGYGSFIISSPGPLLHGTKWLLWCLLKQKPTFHSKCGINRGLTEKGETQ